MSFPPHIKKQLMIDSARRCCVCHRYKGVGVEVHHIHQRAYGGQDTYENGIVLCFDCHCAAGHYNNNHPRGTKFSPDELKGHKDRWFDSVKNNPQTLGENTDDHKIVCRYYLTSDRETATQVLDLGEKSMVRSKYLLRTAFLEKQFRDLISAYPGDVQDDDTDGWSEDFFPNRKQLLENYPEFNGCQTLPVSERMVKEGKLKDPFTRKLIESGAQPAHVAYTSFFNEVCGGSGWGVEYQTRKPYFVFAQISNLGDECIQITSLNNQPFELNPLTDADVFDMSELRDIYSLNKMELSKEESINIFLGVIAGPIDYNPTSYQFENGPEIDEYFDGDTVIRTILNSEGTSNDFATCRKLYIPKTVSFLKDNHEYEVAFEDFRPDTLFLISREWMCGSCPHLFGIDKQTGEVTFIQTLFDNSAGTIIEESIDCDSFSKVIIAEFDNETSYITSMQLDGKEVLAQKELKYGDAIEIDVSSNKIATIKGLYHAIIPHPQNSEQRRQKSSKFKAYEKELKNGFLKPEQVCL